MISLALVSSCKTGEYSQTGYNHPDSIFASIERSPCFGRCPVYKAVIYNSGKAVYEGRSSVVRQGLFHGVAGSGQIQHLRLEAEKLRLDTLQAEFIETGLADFPSHRFSIVVKGMRKEALIKHSEPPDAVMRFEKLLDDEIEKITWIKVSDSE